LLEELAMNEMTRRQYLVFCMSLQGVDIFTAKEAVASTAIEHPEWDMDEKKSINEWDKEYEHRVSQDSRAIQA
jgi:hypothetical protein